MLNIHAYRNATEQYLGITATNGLPLATKESEGGLEGKPRAAVWVSVIRLPSPYSITAIPITARCWSI